MITYFEYLTLSPRMIEEGDVLLSVDGEDVGPFTILNVVHSGPEHVALKLDLVRAEGIESWVYPEHGQVARIKRPHTLEGDTGTVLLTEVDIVTIMDSLLVMAEGLEKDGNPSGQVRAALAKIKTFAAQGPADPGGQVIARATNPDTFKIMLSETRIDDLEVAARTFNTLMRKYGYGAQTVGDLVALPAKAVEDDDTQVVRDTEDTLAALRAQLAQKAISGSSGAAPGTPSGMSSP